MKVERRAGAIAVALLALVVTASALRNGFALDDVHIIAENARVHTLDSFWKLFAQTYWPPEQGASLYRPLTMLSFAVQWAIGNGSPLVFHGSLHTRCNTRPIRNLQDHLLPTRSVNRVERAIN